MTISTTFRTIALSAAVALGSTAVAAAQTATPWPSYDGTPNVALAGSLIASGGGPGSFSTVRAFGSMIGSDALYGEQQKLASIYGQHNADLFVHMFDYVVNDAWVRAGQDNVIIPESGSDSGRPLAADIVRAGTTPDGKFWTSYLFDKTMGLHVTAQVMSDLNLRYGPDASASFGRMANQFFHDLSQTIGTSVGLAPNH
jgi:hypothetical protein